MQFHKLCDSKGPTVTVARVKDIATLVGGYTRVPWSSDGHGKRDDTTFLFNNRANATSITKFAIKPGRGGADDVYHSKAYGPSFGPSLAADLTLLHGSLDNCYSMANAYQFSGYALTGHWEYQFSVTEVEVFAVRIK